MQVNIKKDGKQNTYNLINSWDDVTLDKWAKLIDSKSKSKTKEALDTISLLSDIPRKLVLMPILKPTYKTEWKRT